MKKSTKCTCGQGHKITCPICSNLKMTIMLKNGNNHLKLNQGNGRLVNPVWYNHLSKNNKSTQILINAMSRRFKDSIYATVSNKVIFYDNKTKEELLTLNV